MQNKIGIFGGTFNPIHKGHLDSLQQVQRQFQLDVVYLVPAFQNPFKVHETTVHNDTTQEQIHEASSQEPAITGTEVSHLQRLKLIRLAVKDLPDIQIDTQEISRQGPSYSIDTVRNMLHQHPQSELFFIMGIDVFEQFDKWRDFEHILQLCHLIVMSRPRWQLPQQFNELPKGIQPQVKNFNLLKVQLKTHKNIFLTPLKETALSSTQIRSGLLKGKNMKPTMPRRSADHINKHKLYQN